MNYEAINNRMDIFFKTVDATDLMNQLTAKGYEFVDIIVTTNGRVDVDVAGRLDTIVGRTDNVII